MVKTPNSGVSKNHGLFKTESKLLKMHLDLKSTQPIGIFDSGVGGLTLARALIHALPNENIIYFGDTAHFPYGDKSVETIQNYAEKITSWLIQQGCKLILIACNTASAAAYDLLHQKFGQQALVVNVIDPLVMHLAKNYMNKTIGLIGTKLTINSNIYPEKLAAQNANIQLLAKATPLITTIIEEGFAQHKIIDTVLDIYLGDPIFKNARESVATGIKPISTDAGQSNEPSISALVLACTHYPLIVEPIRAYYKQQIEVIDAATIVADEVSNILQTEKLLNAGKKQLHKFYISDYTPSFAQNAKLFFGHGLNVEQLTLS